MIAESIVFHVDPDEVVQSRRWEAEDARDFLCVEEIGCFVPVNPHASKIVAEKVVERVSGDKA